MKYFTDGWMMGSNNPSPYGGGYTVIDENNKLIKEEEFRVTGFTNNEAEIRGIKFALEYAVKGDTISTDSMCCLTWVNKGKSKARPDLRDLLEGCKKLKNEKEINLIWEGRDFNLAGIYNENNRDYKKRKRLLEEVHIKPCVINECTSLQFSRRLCQKHFAEFQDYIKRDEVERFAEYVEAERVADFMYN